MSKFTQSFIITIVLLWMICFSQSNDKKAERKEYHNECDKANIYYEKAMNSKEDILLFRQYKDSFELHYEKANKMYNKLYPNK